MQDLKKVFFVTQTMTFGGVEKVISTLANSFTQYNIECTIATIVNVESEFVLDEKVRHVPLYEKKGHPPVKEYGRCYKKLRRMVDIEKPDVVVIMPEEISCKAIPFLLGSKVPIIVSERNNPWVMPRKKINRILRSIYYPKVSGIVFQTSMAATFFSNKIRKKSRVIMNPLDTTRLPEVYKGERKKKIVTMGRLDSQKNHKLLIEAFARFNKKNKDYELYIYGDGNLKDELKKYAEQLNVGKKVYLPGATNDVLTKVNDAAMFVLSSDYEGLPNALIEAMAIGLPCISTDCPSGGPYELIEDGDNGILVDVNDVLGIAKAMERISNNKKYAERLSENAMEIRKELAPEKIVKQWKNYLCEVAANYRKEK